MEVSTVLIYFALSYTLQLMGQGQFFHLAKAQESNTVNCHIWRSCILQIHSF